MHASEAFPVGLLSTGLSPWESGDNGFRDDVYAAIISLMSVFPSATLPVAKRRS